jgi:Ca2+-binding EF-hand superfamily protein
MKRQDYMRLALLVAATGTVLGASAAHARDGERQMDGPGGRHGGEMFKRADANNDGFLTRDEMLKAHEERVDKMFAELDTDKDGKLSQDEMKAGRKKMHERMQERMKDRRGGMDSDHMMDKDHN